VAHFDEFGIFIVIIIKVFLVVGVNEAKFFEKSE
jgi:hypothetical protein